MDWLYLGLGTAFGTSLIGSSFLTNILLAWLIWELRKLDQQGKIFNVNALLFCLTYQGINFISQFLAFLMAHPNPLSFLVCIALLKGTKGYHLLLNNIRHSGI